MSRLFPSLVLVGAGLLLTPVAASAQFGRPFAMPAGPLTVAPVMPVPLVPSVRIVQPVGMVTPVIGFPHFRQVSGFHYRFGNIDAGVAVGGVGTYGWAFRQIVPSYFSGG